MDGVAVKPLTVGFHEGQFLGTLNQENRAGFWFQLDSDQRQQFGSPMGPTNAQALNRYAYVQNNPLKYTDPSGHCHAHPAVRLACTAAQASWKYLSQAAKWLAGKVKPPAPHVVQSTATKVQLVVNDKQLQAKFKHAGDFGITGNWNKATAQTWRKAIENHVNSSGVQQIKGTYRGENVIHHFDPATGRNVITDVQGNFISAWKLSADQIKHVTTTGKLGGG